MNSPNLFQRICGPAADDHVTVLSSASGEPTARLNLQPEVYLHSSFNPTLEAFKASEQLIFQEKQPILCLGLGLGYYLNALLERLNPSQPVFAYERDPWLLRLTLSLFDFSRDILAGRVRFLLGTDLFPFMTVQGRNHVLWPHPVLGALYEEERRLLQCDPEKIRSGRRAMVASGGLFVSDVVDAMRDADIHVLVWSPTAVSKEETIHQVSQFSPDMILAVNYCKGIPELCESMGIPALIWEIDPTIERLCPGQAKDLDRTCVYTYRKNRVAHFLEAGFKHVEYLPLAANPKRRYPMPLDPDDHEKYGAEVSFVGSSMAENAANLHQLYHQLSKKPSAQASGNKTAGENRTCIENEKGHLIHLGACLAEREASERRGHILARLSLEGLDLHIWGDPGWRKILPDAARYCGFAGHSYEINRIYNATKVNLDINRSYQRDIVTMRVFDILACKAFVLADFGEDLGQLFQLGEEVAAYRSEAEVPEMVKYFLKNERERNDIALAGYQRVLRDHTITSRVSDMIRNIH